MAKTFEARYDGECKWCSAEIQEGDQIGYVDNEIACLECFEDSKGWC